MLEGLAAPPLFSVSLSRCLCRSQPGFSSLSPFLFKRAVATLFLLFYSLFIPPFHPLFQRSMTCQALRPPTDIGALSGGVYHTD